MESEKLKETIEKNGVNFAINDERIKIKESIRAKKEKLKTGRFEKYVSVCPECGSHGLEYNYERGEVVCNECGLVVEDSLIDPGPEWRLFDMGNIKMVRTGAPLSVLFHDMGLTTTMGWDNKDAHGNILSGKEMNKYRRLRKWHRRIKISDGKERGLAVALSELDRMASALGLTKNVREEAAIIYRKAAEKSLIRGRSIESVMSGSLYASCRKLGVPRTYGEIASVSRVSKRTIRRSYVVISKNLKFKLPFPSPVKFLPRFCSPLNLPTFEVQSRAEEILKQAEDRGITAGKGPVGLVMAAIYIAIKKTPFGKGVTQAYLAEIGGTSEVVIRARYKELVSKLQLNK